MTDLSIQYSLSIPDVNAHIAEVSIRVSHAAAGPLEFAMPRWTPGSYLMREFARHVQGLTAVGALCGALVVTKTAPGVWSVLVPRGDCGEVCVSYRLYAHDLSVRCNHVTDEHAFFNGAATFLFVQGCEDLACDLEIAAPCEDWKIYTALPCLDGAVFPLRAGRFQSSDYDHLIDCPVLMGAHQEVAFAAAGTTHRFVFSGAAPVPMEQLALDIPPLVEATAALFEGDIPYRSYLHLVLHTDSVRGGLEHRNSCAYMFPRNHYVAEDGYEDFLSLVSHEHLHAWNVKRIRPQVLGPFDYRHEAYTRALWVMEGVTCYYESVLLLRAGIVTEDRFLALLAKRIGALSQVPGRRLQSLETASLDAWIKHYRPDESSRNTSVSYYLKGEVVGWLLDLEIRCRTEGQRSLDDVMRLLWRRYRAEGTGFVEEELQGWVEDIAGGSLDSFFARFIRGTDEPDYGAALGRLGLALEPVGHDPELPDLGIETREAGDGVLVVAGVRRGSPAESAGVYPGDELVALGREKLDRRRKDGVLRRYRPGMEAELHLFRQGQLRRVLVRFGSKPVKEFAIRRLEQSDDQSNALREGWLARTPRE
jgi:predicted metalloprotease with PDZ domain